LPITSPPLLVVVVLLVAVNFVMKRTYHYWVYARIEVVVDGSTADHKKINDAISDDDVSIKNHPEAHALLTDGHGTNVIETDLDDLMYLSVAE
jgi:hypothetical protein